MDSVTIYYGPTSLFTALGNKQDTLAALEAGQSGLRYNPAYNMVTGAIPEGCVPSLGGLTRFESLVVTCAQDVLHEAGIEPDCQDLLLILSTTKGNVGLLETSLNPVPDEAYLFTSARRVATYLGMTHTPVVISNACISGVSAQVVARDMMLAGQCRHALVVGCDVLTPFIAEGFASFKSISSQPCRPYDAQRDGLTLGEACGAILLTTDLQYVTGPYITLAGGAVTNDANHISGPSRTGDGLYYAISRALAEANLTVGDVGLVNAHGTATAYNDEMESKAIAWAGLSDTPMNSLKGYIGHTLGASGVVETIACLHQLQDQQAYATCGFTTLGTPCPINVSSVPQPIMRPVCVKTASGFGGCNAAIVLNATNTPRNRQQQKQSRTVSTIASYELPQANEPFAQFIRKEYKLLGETNMKFYKMSDLCKAAYVAVANLLQASEQEGWQLDFNDDDVAIILANRSASLDTDVEHQRIVNLHNPEGASPAVFVYTLPNVAAGELCIRHKIRGHNTFFIEDTDTGLAERYAHLLLTTGKARKAICGWCEKMGEHWDVRLKLLAY